MTTPSALRYLALPVCISVAAAQGSPQQLERIVQEGMENSRVMEFQDYLCNHLGSRLTGSDSFTQACEWALGEFEEMGLEVHLEEWDEWRTVWNRGQWSGRVLEPIQLELQVATPAWTAATKGKVPGEIVAMPETAEELAALRPRLADVYLYGRRPNRRSEIRSAFSEAVDQAAPLGYVTASRMGSVDRKYDNQIRVFGNSTVARSRYESRPTTPEIVVRDDQARKIEELLEAGEKVLVEFDIRNRFRRGPIPLHNVIADIRGTEHPDEYVIVCGHLDSWHQAAGATDNGTGTASTLEAARILSAAGVKPKRTIRFILWGGEEQGLLGSRKHVTMHRADMKNVSAVFNHDTGTNWAYSLTVTDAMYQDFQSVIAPVLELPAPDESHDGRTFKLSKTKTMRGGFGGSDHASFRAAGVPAWSWGLRGRSSYGYGWHSQWDTYDIVIPEYQKHTSTVIALVALGVADLPHLLSREGVSSGGGRSQGLDGLISREFGLELKDDMTVSKLVESGPAKKAGLAVGDKLVALWGKPVKERVDVYRAWRGNTDADVIVFTVSRGGEQLKLKNVGAGDAGAEGAGAPSGKKAETSDPSKPEKKSS